MQPNKPSPSQPAIKWAVIGVVTSIIITYAFQFLNVDPNSSVKYLTFIPFIAFLLLTQKEYRDLLGGYMDYGQGFLAGLLYSIFIGVLTAIFTYLYYAILSPEMIEKTIAATQTQLEAKGLSQDQIDTALNMTRKYFVVFGTIGALLGSIIIGAIVSLIGAAIFKKERSPFDVQDYSAPAPQDPAV